MPIVPHLWMELCTHFSPLHVGIMFGLSLHIFCAFCYNLWEFTCASSLGFLSVFFKHCKVIYFLWFLGFFYCPFLLRSLGRKGRSVRSLVHLVLVHLVSYFLHGDQLWLSGLITNYCEKKVL